jgi:phosphate/phosphite/phosphonate ABC transporter binding protein
MQFVEFLTGEPCRSVMESNGYVPLLVSLVIGTVPEQNVLRQEERFRPLAAHLSSEMGAQSDVRIRHFASYRDVVREFLGGRVNAAFLGSFTYVEAHDRIALEPVARPEVDGISEYRGLILVERGGGISDWEDLRGTSISMVEDTTAGDLFPRLYLRRNGVDRLEEFVGRIVIAGSHEESIRKLLSGEVRVAAAKDRIFRNMVRADPSIAEHVVAIAESEPVPENALVVRRDIDVVCFGCHASTAANAVGGGRGLDFVDLLRVELLRLDAEPGGRAVLDALGADRFVETRHEDYVGLEAMIAELEGTAHVANGTRR